MGADLYRDAYLGIRARLADLGTRAREREAEATEAFWSSLEPNVRERLALQRRAMDQTSSESLEDLMRAESELAAYVAELDQLVASIPDVEEAWREVPDRVEDPPFVHTPWPHGTPALLDTDEFMSTFAATVRESDAQAELALGPMTCLAHFEHRRAPFALRATVTSGNSQLAEVAMHLVTSIPRATPALVVRHESVFLSIGKAFGVKGDVELGDASFDGLFLVEGSREAAELLLPARVRDLLMVLAKFDVPTLEVDPRRRTASLKWRFEPARQALDAAVRILASVRETRAEVRFRT